MKLMVIGIDAMDPRMLFDNIDMFPNMKRLYKEGSSAKYDAYAYGYGSAENWVSLYTGLSPYQHGIRNNKNTRTNKFPVYNDYKNKNPFWKILSENDISSAIWRGLATSPGEKINGYIISGEINYGFDGSKIEYESMIPQCHKDDQHIQDQFIKGDIGYPIPPKKPSDYGFTWEELFEDNSLVDKILKEDNYYEDGYLYLKKELAYYRENIINTQISYPTDVLFYYTQTLDLIQHFQSYDPHKRIILESMKLVDEFIGSLINKLDPENILIISDHGSSSFKGVLDSNNIQRQKETFGWRDNSIWLDNGEIIAKARNGGFFSAFHDIKGTFIASGKEVKRGNIKDMRTLDFYPTLLELFGIKIPDDREGYVLDIFEKDTLINQDKLLKYENIEYKKIAIIQNREVSEFNRVINEIFLDHRFYKLTLFCEERYMNTFKKNPRLARIVSLDKIEDNTEMLKEFEYIYSGCKDEDNQGLEYVEVREWQSKKGR